MLSRLVTASIAIPLVVLLAAWFPPYALAAVVALLAALGFLEFSRLARAQGIQSLVTLGALATALLAVSPALPDGGPAEPLLTFAVLTLLVAILVRRVPLREALPGAAATVLGMLWLGWLLSYLIKLHQMAPRGAALLVLLGAVWLGDSGAMWVGKWLGRHPLAPELSPKKTMEGLAGQLGFTVLGLALAAYLAGERLSPGLDRRATIGLGLLLGAAATVGDLAESAFKRGAGVKDSGGLFPGHGGVLDRIDSLLFAAPVMYYCLVWLGRG